MERAFVQTARGQGMYRREFGNVGNVGTGSAAVQKKFYFVENGRNNVPNVPYSILGIVLCQVNLGFYGVMSI
jgi:hypothetical protein